MKYLLTSDLHIGNNKNNPIFLDISLNYAKWLKHTAKKHDITEIIIAGDFFHDRNSVNLRALDTGHKFLDCLSEFQIHIITGNHDAWFLDNSDIHSLSPFKTRKNVHIYDELTTVGGITYCPWGTTAEMIPDGSNVLIGHWNLVSFQMAKGKICDHGVKGTDLMEKCNMAFSGHFHKPQLRTYAGKPLRMLGSAFQLNWGESGETKFCYILDSSNNTITEIENTVSPRFEYIHTEDDLAKIKGNFITFQIVNDEAGNLVKDRYEALQPILSIPNFIEKTVVSLDKQMEEFQLVQIEEATEEFLSATTYMDEVKNEIKKEFMKLHDSFS